MYSKHEGKRYFTEPKWFYAEMFFWVMGSIGVDVLAVYAVLNIKEISNDIGYFPVIITAFLAALNVPYTYTVLLPRTDWICVSKDNVLWRGIARKGRQLRFDQCTFIGIETFNKEGHRTIIRGDENAMIYFTTEPYPEEFRGRINHVHCSDTFIKFRYTDELARTLLEVLPEDKKPAIQAFYNQMQNRDYERQKAIRAWKNNRARRKREKERREQKKG